MLLCQALYCQIEDPSALSSRMDNTSPMGSISSSPEAANFHKINFLPINLYTGKIDINAPLYTIKTGDIEVPIRLRYDMGNNKVDNAASIVGWGWTLDAGGSIIKMVRDIDDQEYSTIDEIVSCTSGPDCNEIGLRHNSTKLSRLGYLRRVNDEYAGTDSSYIAMLNEDAQPDLFMANAPGLSTQFYLERNSSIYNPSNGYQAKPLDGSLTRIEDVHYNSFNVETIKNYAGFRYQDAAPNLAHYINRNGSDINVDNPLYYIRGFDNYPGIMRSKNKDYSNFNLTNDKGVKYSFETFDINESVPAFDDEENSYYGQPLYNYPNLKHFYSSYKINKGAWYVDKITDINNRSVKFTYKPFYTFEYDKIDNYSSVAELDNHVNEAYKSAPLKTFNKTTQQQFVEKISWDEGDVLFYYNFNRTDRPNAKALTEVIVKNKQGNIIKHYRFNYSYFTSTEASCNAFNINDKMNCSRLKLDNIEELDTSSNPVSEYKFEYNKPNEVSPLHSYDKDFLGYYNAASNKPVIKSDGSYKLGPRFTFSPNNYRFSIIPFTSNILNSNNYININGEISIDPNHNSLNGLLNKITYPTGGTTDIVYENNTFNFNNITILSGGARVKSQLLDDGNGNKIIKNYEYLNEDGSSSGYILNFPKIAEIIKNKNNPNDTNFSFNVYSYNLANIELTQGSYIGYRRIVERIVGNGKTEYLYNSPKEIPNEYESPNNNLIAMNSFYPGRAYTNYDNRRGTLAKTTTYDNTNTKLSEDIYNYNNHIISSNTKNFSHSSFEVGGFGFFIPEKENYSIKITNSINQPSSKKSIKYLSGQIFEINDEYNYKNEMHHELTSVKTTLPNNDVYEISYQYPYDKNNQKLNIANISSKILQSTKKKNGKVISDTEMNYDDPNNLLPTSITSFDLQENAFKTDMTYDLYDEKGNTLQYTVKGKPTSIIWGYNQTKPIAKIEGVAYNQVSAYVSGIISASDTDNTQGTDQSEQALVGALDLFRNNPALSGYQITTYTYNPLIGVTSITPPSGIRELYKYDLANRLESVKDVNGNLLKEFQYQYKKEVITHYNTEKSQPFTRNNCSAGTTPGTYTYIVPANKYSSIISKADAEQQAQNDININGQTFANNNATCTPIITYYSTVKSQTFTKNNCSAGTTPGTYTYTVQANKYTSTINQADADQKAQNDINANGQEQANLYATCTQTSCTFNPVTTGIAATFTPSGSSNVYYNLNFSSSTKPYFNFDSKQNVLIGKIDPGCAPTSTFQIGKSEGGRYWMITIEPSGNFYLQLLNGSVNSGSFSISDSYSKNGSIN